MDDECSNCGAPRTAGLTACSYCDTPYPGAGTGISCPSCGSDNERSRTTCVTCSHSLVIVCIFCDASTRIGSVRCGSCGEVFEGAEDRKRERAERERQQQMVSAATQGAAMIGGVVSSPQGREILGQIWDKLDDVLE